MARPEKNRFVQNPPLFNAFKPVGASSRALDDELLSLDEFEAFRLTDYSGLSPEEASLEMELSRSTFTRLVERARKKIAGFLVGGKILRIEGGNIHFLNNMIRCLDCGSLFKMKMGELISKCPQCHSQNLLNLAGGYGHGKCCVEKSKKEK